MLVLAESHPIGRAGWEVWLQSFRVASFETCLPHIPSCQTTHACCN